MTNIDTGVALPKSGIRAFDDVRKREYSVGASGGGSTTVMFPSALIAHAGARFKLVRGYKGTADIILALERGEVDIVGAYGLPGMLVTSGLGEQRRGGDPLPVRAQTASAAGRTCRRCRSLRATRRTARCLRAVAGTGDIGRSILTTPGVPAERLMALRKAFAAMLADPEFIAAAEQRKLMLDPATGEEMDAIVQQTLGLSAAVVARIGEAMK